MTGTLQKMIDNHHRGTVYAEADLSEYNPDAADSFEYIAYQWHIDVKKLFDGPMVMVMHGNDGNIFWASSDTPILTLLERVDAELSRVEEKYYGKQPQIWDITIDESDISEFEQLNPWNKHKDLPEPKKVEAPKKPKFELKEPEKSVT